MKYFLIGYVLAIYLCSCTRGEPDYFTAQGISVYLHDDLDPKTFNFGKIDRAVDIAIEEATFVRPAQSKAVQEQMAEYEFDVYSDKLPDGDGDARASTNIVGEFNFLDFSDCWVASIPHEWAHMIAFQDDPKGDKKHDDPVLFGYINSMEQVARHRVWVEVCGWNEVDLDGNVH